MPQFPQGAVPTYETVLLTGSTAKTILKQDGTVPTVLVGFGNHSFSNQTASVVLSDSYGSTAGLPQIGQLAASQFISCVPPGIVLLNGLIATPSGAPVAPGIAVYIR